jgi:hypothetical protein
MQYCLRMSGGTISHYEARGAEMKTVVVVLVGVLAVAAAALSQSVENFTLTGSMTSMRWRVVDREAVPYLAADLGTIQIRE